MPRGKTGTKPGTKIGHRATKIEIDEALVALIAFGGHADRAAEHLLENGFRKVSGATLRYWRDRHRPRFLELSEKHAPQLERHMIQNALATAELANQAENAAIEKALDQIKTGDVKDASQMAKNFATVKGINVDKALILMGRPSTIVGHQSAEDLMKKLVELAPGVVSIEGEAEELAPQT